MSDFLLFFIFGLIGGFFGGIVGSVSHQYYQRQADIARWEKIKVTDTPKKEQ